MNTDGESLNNLLSMTSNDIGSERKYKYVVMKLSVEVNHEGASRYVVLSWNHHREVIVM